MKLKFLAGAGKLVYSIQGSVIEGIDTSSFVEGSKFFGNEETQSAGIFNMFWEDGELHVVLAQPTSTTGIPWSARDNGWIDAGDYIPGKRYVAATDPNALALIAEGKAEYALIDGKWTVSAVDVEENENA